MIRKNGHRWALAASLAITLAALPTLSEARPYGGHWHGGGWGWGPAIGVALGVDLALSAPYSPYYYGYPPVVVAPPPPVVYASPPVAVAAPAPVAPATMPDPVIYPRNGQSPAQTEQDMRACNAWATSQPRAQADASVFQRATAACMDGRGYSIR